MIHVSDIRPKPAFSGGPRQALIEHSHRRIVRAGHLRAQYEGFQSLIERREQLRRLAHPSAHRLVRDVDAKPREDLSLAMQWQMIGDLTDDHVRQNRRPRGTLGNRRRRLGSRLYSALASVFLANILNQQELRWDVFVALAGLLAEQMQILLAGGTMLFFRAEIVLDALPFQVRRRRPAPWSAAVLFDICLARGGIGGRKLVVLRISLG